MKIIISSHQGNLYNEEVDYVVIHSDSDGEYAVMKDHIPVVSIMENGFIKLVRDKDEYYVVIVSGVFEFHDNVATCLVQEAHIGKTKESALEHLKAVRAERLEQNRKESVDFEEKAKELRENIKNSKAGHL